MGLRFGSRARFQGRGGRLGLGLRLVVVAVVAEAAPCAAVELGGRVRGRVRVRVGV